jgi:3-hydroxyisobutyrate dehydrogenase
MSATTPVAVLGAGGTMGKGMARNLAGAGLSVRAWNRSREKAEDLAADGAEVLDTPAEAVRGAEAIVTILSEAEAVLEVMEEAAAATAPGTVWLQMSTIGIAGVERCEELAGRHGLVHFDAPVLGTKKPAEEGQLVILASGPEEGRERLEPIFSAIGKRTLWAGEAGAGSRLKVAVNAWIVSVVEAGAETIALAEAIGLDPNLVLEAISDGPLDLPYLKMKGAMMIERDFPASFRLALAAKDAGLVVAAAESAGLELPMLEAVASRLDEAAEEHGDKDLSAAFLVSAGARTGG